MLRPIAIAVALLALAIPARAGDKPPLPKGHVFKSDSCQCCNKWVQHMRDNGFDLEGKDIQQSERTRMRAHFGLRPEQAACHTAVIEGYIVEGHVPAEDVKRLLTEKPDAKGLSVPEMPAGSPGMEMEDGTSEPYEVLLLKKDGTTEVFSRR
jgi:hypothetical protein